MSGTRNILPCGRYSSVLGGLLALVLVGSGGLSGCGEPSSVGQSTPDGVHAAGWKEEHGQSLRTAHATDLPAAIGECEQCHGQGDDAPTCDSCHKPGPDGCRTCHDTLPDTHTAHGATPDRIGAESEAACGYCHKVPETWRDADHLNDRGAEDIVFSGRATAREHAPVYADGKCTNTACHNGPGARVPVPAWGTEFAHPVCGSCHGLPPPAPHPNSTKCQNCHGEVAPASIRNLESPHPNGKVVVDMLDDKECDACHGAPPESGAHAAHLGATLATPVACETCHKVPVKVTDEGHLDDGTPGVEVRLNPDVAGPQAAFARGKCSNVTCHGGDTPAWNGEAPCGSCHGVPPVGHPAGECARCHPNALPDGMPVDPAEHMNGSIDNRTLAADACDTCHTAGASVALPAPHEKHVRFGCETCHVKPATPQDEGHMNGSVELRIQGLPERGGDGSPVPGVMENGRCNVPTCHGEGRPQWAARQTPLACDSCHGNPPPAPHTSGMRCENCHGGNTHANGTLDTNFGEDCTHCHGNPPESGAHLAHTSPRFSRPVPCETCHITPTMDTLEAPTHFGPPPAEVTLQNGRYDPTTGRCSNVTCHNALGATGVPLIWTQVDSGAATCGACHGVPPPGHGPVDCVHCHAPTAGPGMTIREPMNHVNGTLDRSGAAVIAP